MKNFPNIHGLTTLFTRVYHRISRLLGIVWHRKMNFNWSLVAKLSMTWKAIVVSYCKLVWKKIFLSISKKLQLWEIFQPNLRDSTLLLWTLSRLQHIGNSIKFPTKYIFIKSTKILNWSKVQFSRGKTHTAVLNYSFPYKTAFSVKLDIILAEKNIRMP